MPEIPVHIDSSSMHTTLSARDLIRQVGALAFASGFVCFLLALRVVLIGRAHQLYLVWNLFLAWMPLFFALCAVCVAQNQPHRRVWFACSASAWLLFFPNAPYILTDLIHLGSRHQARYWTDLVSILLFVSLFLMQRLVARRFGWPGGWLFVMAVSALSGFGIYAGRFLRWNSWDVVFSPWSLLSDAFQWFASIPDSRRGIVIPLLFGTLMFVSYLMLYALTHLPQPIPALNEASHERDAHAG
jgi:uncharacterized membrane protein